MKLQVISLEPYDDVVSVRDRLSFVQADRVLLVWPTAASTRKRILCRKLDLVLIQRESARRHTKLALVTSDPDVIDNAEDLNISVFASVQAAQRGRWRHPLNSVFVDRSGRPEASPDPYELRLVASRLKRLTPQQRRVRAIVRQLVVVVLIAAVLLVTYVLVPSADVILTPAQDQLNATVQLVADSTFSGLDVEGARIPAAVDVIEVQDDATIPTTGSVDVPNTLASGIITFTNQTNQQVFVPVKTVVATAGVKPVRFETTNEVTIGAGVGKTANVAIQAAQDSAGPIGNIPSNLIVTIEGPLSKALAARNIDATQGGTLRHQGVVTQNDLDNLLSAAREKLRQKALGAFVLTPNQFVVPATIKIAEERPEWTIYSAFKGDQADSLTLTLRVRAQALIVDIQQARQVTFARLVRGLNSGRLVSPDSVTYTDPIDLHVDGNGLVSFTLSATANVAVSISPDAVRGLIAGANVDDALYKLQQTLILDSYHPPQIAIYPGILRRLPVLGARINVIVRGAA